MYGAVIGDIAGSKYEFENYNEIPNEIMDEGTAFTDDTVLTVAIADALLNGKDLVNTIREWVYKYQSFDVPGGYGKMFINWLNDDTYTPYFSCGNGSAMRVSAVAWLARDEYEVIDLATRVTIITHNHPEGIKGAQATAYAIFLARQHISKYVIKEKIEKIFGYNLSRTCDEIRRTHKHNELCQLTVPESIIAFLESNSFEEAIKLAISFNGDADTMAAIAGSIAEAYYGISNKYINIAKKKLPKEMIDILDRI